MKTVAVSVCFLESTFQPKVEFRASKIPRDPMALNSFPDHGSVNESNKANVGLECVRARGFSK